MAKTPNTDRKFLQNIRTTKSNSQIEAVLSSTIAAGEIAVQMGSGDTTDESKVTTGLWTLAADGITPVRIPSETWVKNEITSGASIAVENVIEAVGLNDSEGENKGKLPSDWKDNTEFITSSTSVIDAVKDLDNALTTVSGDIETTILAVSGNIESTILALDTDSVFNENKVVTDVTQSDGKITAIASNITGVKLDGYTVGGDDSGKIASTDTLGAALGKLQGQINGMDKAASAADGQVVTTVSEVDGKVSETKANVKDLQLSGYSKDTTATGAIAGTDTINTALSKLENTVAANKISNADKSIVVTEPTGTATTTDIKVNIKSGEKVIKLGEDGIYTNLNVVKITEELPATVKERYELRDSDDVKIGASIDIAKDSHIVSITYITDSADTHYQNLQYVYIDASGATQTVYVDMSSLVLEAEFASGVGITNHVAHGVVDPASEKDESNVAFLTVDGPGFKISGIKDAIDTKINKLDVTDTAAAGQYVSSVSETDGKIAVSRANVSEAVLNNYTKGSDATAVADTDTLNQAISKLENQVDNAKAAATTKVVEGTDEGNNMTIVPSTGADESVTYTVNLTDVASKAALDAEIAARKAVDGQTGQTYAANTSANYISAATSLNDADVKLDAVIGKVTDETVSDYNVEFTGSTTVAKSISDIKKDIAAFKSGLTVTDDEKYINTTIAKNGNTTTIDVGAIVKEISASTSSDSALVDSWDAKQYAITDRKTSDGLNNGGDSGIAVVSATNDSGKLFDFSHLVVDCGTF